MLLAGGVACGRGYEAESGGVSTSIPGTETGATGESGRPPFLPNPPAPPEPTGGFGPMQVTPTREQAKVFRPPADASEVTPEQCWASPALTEYTLARPGGRPGSVAVAADGSVWFSDWAAQSVGRLEPSGAVTRYQLPAGRSPGSLAAPRDGSVWFVTTGPAIAHLTKAGRLVGYAIPTTQGNPMGGVGTTSPAALTAGPDGAIWFLEMGADKVGRVTPEGAITEYPLPDRERMHANPEGMAVGSDGAIWFSETLKMRMGRIDPKTFAITEFPIPPTPVGVGAARVVAGPDSALWFDGGGPGLSRMTTKGDVTVLTLPWQGQYSPNSITTGPDGRMWFIDSRYGKVVRTTLQGEVTELPPVADPKGLYGAGLEQMTADSDAVWFAEPEVNRIGRFACRQAAASGGV